MRPELRDLEREMEGLDVTVVLRMDPGAWYEFLREKYFRWKYTAPNRYTTTTRQLQKYLETGTLDDLHAIHQELFSFDISDAARGLAIASQIRGLGTAGASGLLSLLFPGSFGTVDQFVVKALRQVRDLPQAHRLARMNPEGLNVDDGAMLIGMMRAKAEDLNLRCESEFWTPRRVDMVLWTYGR